MEGTSFYNLTYSNSWALSAVNKIFFGLLFFLTTYCYSQEKVLNGVATIKLPPNAAPIKLIHTDDKVSSTPVDIKKVYTPSKSAYKVGDIIITLNAVRREKSDLAETKRGLDDLGKDNPDYSSVLKKVNGNLVLTTFSIFNSKGLYHLYTSSEIPGSQVNGIIEFPISKKAKAKQLLDNLIESLKFSD